MDDKLRLERNSLKSALDSSHSAEKSRAVEAAKKEAEREGNRNEKRLAEEKEQLQTQINALKKEIAALKQSMVDAVNEATKQGDKNVSKGLPWILGADSSAWRHLWSEFVIPIFRHLRKEKKLLLIVNSIKKTWTNFVMILMVRSPDLELRVMKKWKILKGGFKLL
jgi:regulator of replication initiation timing